MFAEFIDRCGVRPLALVCGVSPITISVWKHRNSIPFKHWAAIMAAYPKTKAADLVAMAHGKRHLTTSQAA